MVSIVKFVAVIPYEFSKLVFFCDKIKSKFYFSEGIWEFTEERFL